MENGYGADFHRAKAAYVERAVAEASKKVDELFEHYLAQPAHIAISDAVGLRMVLEHIATMDKGEWGQYAKSALSKMSLSNA